MFFATKTDYRRKYNLDDEEEEVSLMDGSKRSASFHEDSVQSYCSIPATNNDTLSSSYESVPRSCDCGANIAEALALGCKYGSLAAAWLPEHCRDDDLTAEFERSGTGPNGTWEYWADTKHTQPMSLGEIAALADHPGQKFHMDNEWHVIHCMFYWRKEHRARFNGKIVEPRSDNEGHIKHCGHTFKHGAYGTVAGVPLNTDHGHFG